MASSLFGGQTSQFGGSIKAQGGVKITIPSLTSGTVSAVSGGGPRLALQSLQAQGQRQLSTFFDLSSDFMYYVTGMVQANASLSNIVGPGKDLFPFLKRFTDPCRVIGNNLGIDLGKGYCQSGGIISADVAKCTLKSCLIEQIQLAVSVQDFVITQQAAMRALDIETE